MPDLVQVTLGTFILAVFAASVLLWIRMLARWRAGAPILPAEPRTAVPWKIFDLYLVFLLYVAAQWVAARLVVHFTGPVPGSDDLSSEFLTTVLASNTLANLLVVLASITYLRLRCGGAIGDLGFLPWRPRQDVTVGLLTFVAALAPVFAIQFLLTRWFKSEHPVQLLLSENSSPRVLVLCFLSAVVAAPLAEEFLFRVLLQGWMEAVVQSWRERAVPQAGPVAGSVPAALTASASVENEETPDTADNPYASPAQTSAPTAPVATIGPRLMAGPIVGSALAFALVHLGHGPDPIPLFVFALMLGYLYQKTHRIWPGLVLHASLNAWSLTVLWLNLKLGLGE
jgi:membrane protease YdiL (CAAX protease family)